MRLQNSEPHMTFMLHYQIGECKGLQETVASLKQQLSEALEFKNLSPIVTSRTGSKNLHEELCTEKDNEVLHEKNEVFLLQKQVFLLLWHLSICLIGKFEFCSTPNKRKTWGCKIVRSYQVVMA